MINLTNKELDIINLEIKKIKDKLNNNFVKELNKSCNKIKNSFPDISSVTIECEKLNKINKDMQILENDTIDIFQEIKNITFYKETTSNE